MVKLALVLKYFNNMIFFLFCALAMERAGIFTGKRLNWRWLHLWLDVSFSCEFSNSFLFLFSFSFKSSKFIFSRINLRLDMSDISLNIINFFLECTYFLSIISNIYSCIVDMIDLISEFLASLLNCFYNLGCFLIFIYQILNFGFIFIQFVLKIIYLICFVFVIFL